MFQLEYTPIDLVLFKVTQPWECRNNIFAVCIKFPSSWNTIYTSIEKLCGEKAFQKTKHFHNASGPAKFRKLRLLVLHLLLFLWAELFLGESRTFGCQPDCRRLVCLVLCKCLHFVYQPWWGSPRCRSATGSPGVASSSCCAGWCKSTRNWANGYFGTNTILLIKFANTHTNTHTLPEMEGRWRTGRQASAAASPKVWRHEHAKGKDTGRQGHPSAAGQHLQQVVYGFSPSPVSYGSTSATFLPIFGRKCVSMFLLTTPYWPHKHRRFHTHTHTHTQPHKYQHWPRAALWFT